MKTAYFQNLPEHLCHHLSEARTSISAAICWFSHKDIFEVLLERLQSGVRVELLLEYDSQNIRDGGLDFQQFIRLGGQLWACRGAGLMHHKFALVNQKLLLTGSYNWTYNSNAENLLTTDDEKTVEAFQGEFERLKSTAARITQVRRSDVKVFAAFPLFEKVQFPLSDLRKKVSLGANTWIVRMDGRAKSFPFAFEENRLPFDVANHLAAYWKSFRIWDEGLFGEEIERLKPIIASNSTRNLHLWGRRMKIGDLIFVCRKNRKDCVTALFAIGIVQSQPQAFEGQEFSSFRSVQWLKTMEKTPYLLSEKNSGQPVSRFKGSVLRVLQEVFEPTNLP